MTSSQTTSKVPTLTSDTIDMIANDGMRNAAGGIYTGSVHPFARAIKQAVRAQWAAEVENWKAAHFEMRSNHLSAEAHLSAVLEQVRDIAAERDAAQAEAKALKKSLNAMVGLWLPTCNTKGWHAPDYAQYIDARAALQPREGEQA